eukprot:GHVU01210755.1.p1 GENE.GHVU01210755.1~~GHVU01210755.1.p1  ORF type:complete len:271 (+),score=81.14 GHVU01210755.1:1036-1848(+)
MEPKAGEGGRSSPLGEAEAASSSSSSLPSMGGQREREGRRSEDEKGGGGGGGRGAKPDADADTMTGEQDEGNNRKEILNKCLEDIARLQKQVEKLREKDRTEGGNEETAKLVGAKSRRHRNRPPAAADSTEQRAATRLRDLACAAPHLASCEGAKKSDGSKSKQEGRVEDEGEHVRFSVSLSASASSSSSSSASDDKFFHHQRSSSKPVVAAPTRTRRIAAKLAASNLAGMRRRRRDDEDDEDYEAAGGDAADDADADAEDNINSDSLGP